MILSSFPDVSSVICTYSSPAAAILMLSFKYPNTSEKFSLAGLESAIH